MTIDDLDYLLPPELIAQTPAVDRQASRLLHYRRADESIRHRRFEELDTLVRPGDLLVMNDAKVTPARFMLIKPTGGKVEGLFVEQRSPGRWWAMFKNMGPTDPQRWLSFEGEPGLRCKVIDRGEGGQYEIELETAEPAHAVLERVGRMPLPPYIKREKGHDDRDPADRDRYQTVYARSPGSIAAPTAGLHFTPELFGRLERLGVERAFVTLHVGLGTFKLIEVHDLSQHVMHIERYELSAGTCEAINRARQARRRVVVVGTTTARVLESQPAGVLVPRHDQTNLFIRPPYQWKFVDAMITNFHLPRSTLIALVAGLVGVEQQRRIYREAIEDRYRFFSYGDAMMVE